MNIILIEPLKLAVGKEYKLNNIKEIEVTDEFLTLNKDNIKCQNEESLVDCKTQQHLDAVLRHCKCLPFAISDDDKVIKTSAIQVFILQFLGSLCLRKTVKVCKRGEN